MAHGQNAAERWKEITLRPRRGSLVLLDSVTKQWFRRLAWKRERRRGKREINRQLREWWDGELNGDP